MYVCMYVSKYIYIYICLFIFVSFVLVWVLEGLGWGGAPVHPTLPLGVLFFWGVDSFFVFLLFFVVSVVSRKCQFLAVSRGLGLSFSPTPLYSNAWLLFFFFFSFFILFSFLPFQIFIFFLPFLFVLKSSFLHLCFVSIFLFLFCFLLSSFLVL